MNFVFISPTFPSTYWQFCDRLKRRGVNVLGIGEDNYDSLDPNLKQALTEYYRVNSMENYEEMTRALGYFVFKYGHIDWLESNNEYWLDSDAHLRTDFNITTGPKADIIEYYQDKSLMKKFYKKAGVITARYILVDGDVKKGIKFAKKVGYPLIYKPVKGVGASDTHKVHDEEELIAFYEKKKLVPYMMEEFVTGDLISFDGITNQDGEIIFCTNHEFPQQIMDVVNEHDSVSYWNLRKAPDDLFEVGSRVVKAFGVKGRFFHNEYFRLTKDKEGLGKVGDLCGLEVNERPPGGYTPDMMNFSDDIDVYDIYARMVTENIKMVPNTEKKYHTVFVGRRDNAPYKYSTDDILRKYGYAMVWQGRMPDILATAMGNEFFMARFKNLKDTKLFAKDVME
ncbi:MAG: ATP-grasp domain-containing protein [Erysipelotrichales bacterium]|nr:ATP-grasp domain-containing protein [Erysipelotrichales bacterium]